MRETTIRPLRHNPCLFFLVKSSQTLMFTVIRYFEQIEIYQPTTLCDSIGFPNTLKHQIYVLGCLGNSERYRQQFRSNLRDIIYKDPQISASKSSNRFS